MSISLVVGVFEGGSDTAALVKYLHFLYIVGNDGYFAGGGVGVEHDVVIALGDVDAHLGDGQLQHDDAVASGICLPLKEVLAALGIGVAVPSVAVVCGLNNGIAGAVVDGEVQGGY